MSKVQIYGNPNSRASRVSWCAQELGIPYEKVVVQYENSKTPEYLSINPNGKFPGLADGELKMFESLAINLYLAKKYGMGKLYPDDIEDEARVLQWTLWAATEVEPALLVALMVALGYSKDEAAAKAAPEQIKPAIKVLDGHLKGQEWMVGNRFSVADINVATVVNSAKVAKIDLSYAPNVEAWLARSMARPSRTAAMWS